MAWEKFRFAEQETTLPAKILLIDELASFIDIEDRSKMRLIDEFQGHMQNITRLGRAAHVHLIAATQSCTSSLFPPSLKNNIAFRTICGRVEANISRMAIDNDAGESIAKVPGSYLGYVQGDILMYQGYWTPKDVALNLGTFKEGYELFKDEDGEWHLEKPEVDDDDDDDFLLDDDDDEGWDDDSDDDFDISSSDDDIDHDFDFNRDEVNEPDDSASSSSEATATQKDYDELAALFGKKDDDIPEEPKIESEIISETKSEEAKAEKPKLKLNVKSGDSAKKLKISSKPAVKSNDSKDGSDDKKRSVTISYIE